MNVPLFGVVWSSSAAIYALKMSFSLQIVDKSMECAIDSLFYGYLASYQSSEYAIKISLTIKSYLKIFSFNIGMLMFTNKEAGLLINVIGENSTTKQLTGDDEIVFGICWGFLAPIIVTGKISLHATVRR